MDAKRFWHGSISLQASQTTWAQDVGMACLCPMRQGLAAYRLLEKDEPSGVAGRTEEFWRHLRHFELLGLIETTTDNKYACNHSWSLESAHISQLCQPPVKVPHAGQFEWIGRPSEGDPAWLWDAEEDRTVAATPEIISQGYCALSYTWGRWRIREAEVLESGTPWRLPTLDTRLCSLDRTQLKALLKSFRPSRYFWVDILCINQDDPTEKRIEIAKQGSIFGNAKAVIVYLWDIPDASMISHCLEDIGSLILDSEFSRDIPAEFLPSLYGRSRCGLAASPGRLHRLPRRGREDIMSRVRASHWFSSLWTLQEMILSPCALWVTADLNYTTLNSRPVTSRLFAAAVQVLNHASMSKTRAVEVLDTKWLHHGANALVDSACPPREERRGALLALRAMRDHEIRQMEPWESWNKNESSLYCCLEAKRADILRAGALRQASGRRGLAVLAALKVEYHRNYEDNLLDPGKIPIALTNTLIRHQGRSIFAVQHTTAGPISGVLPSLSFASLLTTGEYESLSAAGWHIHQDGSLHLPVGTELHNLGWTQLVLMMFNNGGEVAAPAFGAKNAVIAHIKGHCDFKRYKTYEVKFVPLAVRREKQRGLQAALLARESVVGMIIASLFHAGKTTCSLTPWCKVGIYTTSKYKPTKIKSNRRGGYLVSDRISSGSGTSVQAQGHSAGSMQAPRGSE